MQEILDKADPDWKWRPTLLLIEDDRVRIVQGATLLSRIAIGIGPRQAMRIASLVGEQSTPADASSPGRRTFLMSAAAGVATLAGAAILGRPAPAAAQSSGAMAADDKLVAQARATSQITELEQAIAVDFDLEPLGTVRHFDGGKSETLLFYPSKDDPDNVAAALVLAQDSANKTVAGATKVTRAGDAPQDWDFEVLVTSDGNTVTPTGVPEYTGCMVTCVAGLCAPTVVLTCSRLIFAAAILACITASCGSRVAPCHRGCVHLL
ncbi:hypothetical protein HJG43_12310 [Kineosporiaceae bacterium SCSIO 59966]|nr:hypothetical protein HJG43_12310 [Kineosporiaceae bacterium SCSIO 59966]